MSTPSDGERWALWLSAHFAPHGRGGKHSSVWLIEQLGDLAPDQATVSRWLRGQRPRTAQVAAAIGEAVGDRAGALAAAGYADPDPAHLVRKVEGPVSLLIVTRGVDLEDLESMTLGEILRHPLVRIDLDPDEPQG